MIARIGFGAQGQMSHEWCGKAWAPASCFEMGTSRRVPGFPRLTKALLPRWQRANGSRLDGARTSRADIISYHVRAFSKSQNLEDNPLLAVDRLVLFPCNNRGFRYCFRRHYCRNRLSDRERSVRRTPRGEPTPRVRKAVVIKNRLVLATVNASSLNLFSDYGRQRVFSYDFTQWTAKIEKKCSRNVSVSTLTTIVESESRTAFKGFDQFFTVGAFDRNKASDRFIEYFVVGYEAGVPTINRVYFHIKARLGRSFRRYRKP